MDADQIREAFSERWSSLLGNSISRVLYYEIKYADGQVGWTFSGPVFDTVDFGIEILLTSDASLSVMWGRELVQYGLAITDGSPHFAPHASYAMHDVSRQSRWSQLLGRQIEDTRLVWRVSDLEPERGLYLQTAELVVAGGPHAYISAAECRRSRVLTMMDNILVAFDADSAKSSGLLS